VIALIFVRYVQGSKRETVSLQRNFAPFARISVMHVQPNVENINLNTVRSAQKNAGNVLKNAAKWQLKRQMGEIGKAHKRTIFPYFS